MQLLRGRDAHDTKPESNIEDFQTTPEVRVVCAQLMDSFLHLALTH